MKNLKLIIIVILLSLLIFSCKKGKVPEKPEISVTILPYKFFVEKITGRNYKINVMIPPSSSPHSYELSPAQIISISRSIFYFKSGYLDLELGWMEKLASANHKMRIVDTSKGIDLIKGEIHLDKDKKQGSDSHPQTGIDPHVWLSCTNVKIIANNILNSILEYDAKNEKIYRENFNNFINEIESIDKGIRKSLKGVAKKDFIVYHPAWTYFAKEYGLKQISIELEGKSPSPVIIKEIIDFAKKENIKIVFIQKEFDKKNAETIAKEIGGSIVQMNALEEDWLLNMNNILIAMRDALK